MSRGNWEVTPGKGERYLQSVCQDVAIWHAIGEELPGITEAAEYWRKLALDDANDVVALALEDEAGVQESLLRITDLGGQSPEKAARAAAFEVAAHKLQQVKRGYVYGVDNRRARLTVLEPGVVVERSRISFLSEVLLKSQRPALPGEVFEGRAQSLRSSPQEGGRLDVTTWHSALSITGLIDVEEVAPRVKLDLLAKRS